jgi:acetyl-CoA carboxylase biotin carboxyl carrier protein
VDLSPEDVRDVLRVLDSSGLDELHLDLGNLTLTVRREGASGWTAEQQILRRPVVERGAEPAGVVAPRTPRAAMPAGVVEPRTPRAAVPEGLVAVRPPLLGTFYRAPKPGAPPFVDIGDRVEEDTVVGIVETMKMMTPVHAGVRGTVVEFRIDNGEFADNDAVLLLVDSASGLGGLGKGGP